VLAGARVSVYARRVEQALALVDDVVAGLGSVAHPAGLGERAHGDRSGVIGGSSSVLGHLRAGVLDSISAELPEVVVNATPVGMRGGPRPEASPVPVAALAADRPDTVFFDTVYRPLETPMLRAARAAGCRVISGLEMFTRQAASQFAAWTGRDAPMSLFDRVARESMGGG